MLPCEHNNFVIIIIIIIITSEELHALCCNFTYIFSTQSWDEFSVDLFEFLN